MLLSYSLFSYPYHIQQLNEHKNIGNAIKIPPMPKRKVFRTLLAIRQLRDIRGYSQQYLADQMKISVRDYIRIEQGDIMVTLNHLFKIADILNIDVAYLLQPALPDSDLLRLVV